MIHIRQAVITDAPFIIQSQLAMAQETEGLGLNEAVVQKGVHAVFENPSLGAYYLAVGAEGECLGCLLTIPEWSDWRNGTVMWIHSVFVVPQARKLGVFCALYTHLKQKIEHDPKLRGLRLYVDRKNSGAQKVYESLGMSKEHYELYEWLK